MHLSLGTAHSRPGCDHTIQACLGGSKLEPDHKKGQSAWPGCLQMATKQHKPLLPRPSYTADLLCTSTLACTISPCSGSTHGKLT